MMCGETGWAPHLQGGLGSRVTQLPEDVRRLVPEQRAVRWVAHRLLESGPSGRLPEKTNDLL